MTKQEVKFSRNYSKTTLKILFGMSGNECAEPACSQRVIASATDVSDEAVIAQIAHIYALSDDGPRGKKGLTEKERNHHSNLLLLCPTHHTVVDSQYESYPASDLLHWKHSHERKFSDALAAKVSDVGYNELEIAARAVMTTDAELDESTALPIPPAEKITKNKLSGRTAGMLKMGAAKSHDVELTFMNAAQLDTTFPQRLSQGFQKKYKELRSEGLSGDELFDALYVWAGGFNSDPMRQSAALCILSHLFILCEVFEKQQ
ncbi:ABC-three component system protein [Epibacterium ulvae]|uniref:ABC-three component system protein n=1 Tax=Epibacterium ulvae TaxID=1156985 RepID=UPI002492E797|nr:ABC-three component system protein [Epibacterium ulvae]